MSKASKTKGRRAWEDNPYVQERNAQRALAKRLTDIGYKALAKELHPDKVGGSHDAMARLNRIRGKLRNSI
jgi:hypothetical protein